jgi:3-phenylpropionate/trans-cinnamate dioxygenase ferredoxin reductase component
VQNAQDQAEAVGLAIAGKYEPYDSVPRFLSDQYDVKLQMVGLCGRFDQMAARRLIAKGTSFSPDESFDLKILLKAAEKAGA